MNKRIIAMAVVVLVGLSIFASTKTSEPLKNQETHAQASQESKPSETVNVPQEPQKPVEQPVIEPEKPVTWESNPNNCDQTKQYITAESPFSCIDKPVATVQLQSTGLYSGDCEQYRSIISRYNWDVEVAMNVMRVESSCNTNTSNTNDVHSTCVGSYGLFQIACIHQPAEVSWDPESNIAKAYQLYSTSGWSPWSFTTCKKIACY